MNPRTKRSAIGWTMVLSVAVAAVPASANLLVDPGFESNPLTSAGNVLNNFTAWQGVWGVEAATITGVDGGVTPAQGTKMLRMVSDGLTWTQAFQVTDVSSQATLIDSGNATVTLSGLFNAGQNVPAGVGGVFVSFHPTATYGSMTGSISNQLTLDNSPDTWETNSVTGAVPVGTRWLVSQVAYSNPSLVGNPGYVDATDLRLIPEPASLALLTLGGLTLLRRRKR